MIGHVEEAEEEEPYRYKPARPGSGGSCDWRIPYPTCSTQEEAQEANTGAQKALIHLNYFFVHIYQ
jgi:hypothetical protein